MLRITKTLLTLAVIVLALPTASAQVKPRYMSDVDAVILYKDGSEVHGTFRIGNNLSDRYKNKFKADGEEKFSDYVTDDDAVRLTLTTESGNVAVIHYFPVVVAKSKKKAYVTEGNAACFIINADENSLIGYLAVLKHSISRDDFYMQYDKVMGAAIIFRDLNSPNGVMIGYADMMKSTGEYLKIKKHSSWHKVAYDQYFEEVNPEFLEDNPFDMPEVLNIEEFFNTYKASL